MECNSAGMRQLKPLLWETSRRIVATHGGQCYLDHVDNCEVSLVFLSFALCRGDTKDSICAASKNLAIPQTICLDLAMKYYHTFFFLNVMRHCDIDPGSLKINFIKVFFWEFGEGEGLQNKVPTL